jgi:DNA-binding NarL/FixJ family response regulator
MACGGVKVLLVDDEPMFLDALEALLDRDERIVVVARADSGDDALSLARARKPDVALVDLAMPHVDGFEIMRRLLSETEQPPLVIAVSGRSGRRDVERALAAGASGYLLKGRLYDEVAKTILAVSGKAGEAGA